VAAAQAKYDAARAEADMARRNYESAANYNQQPSKAISQTAGRGRQSAYIARQLLSVKAAAEHGAQALLDQAPNLQMLITFWALQGAAGGGLGPSEQAILADTFPVSRTAIAFAVYAEVPCSENSKKDISR
jgi:MFS family permease